MNILVIGWGKENHYKVEFMIPFNEGVTVQKVIECLAELVLYIRVSFDLKTWVFPRGRFWNLSRKKNLKKNSSIQKLFPANFGLYASDCFFSYSLNCIFEQISQCHLFVTGTMYHGIFGYLCKIKTSLVEDPSLWKRLEAWSQLCFSK